MILAVVIAIFTIVLESLDLVNSINHDTTDKLLKPLKEINIVTTLLILSFNLNLTRQNYMSWIKKFATAKMIKILTRPYRHYRVLVILKISFD